MMKNHAFFVVMRFWILLLIGCGLLLITPINHAQMPLQGAWTSASGDLWLFADEATRVAENVNLARFSPDGIYLAIVHTIDEGATLTLLEAAPPYATRQEVVLDGLPAFIRWQGDSALWFNLLTPIDRTFLTTDWALWRLDVASGDLTQAGVGAAYPHPDGRLAVYEPGNYGETDATLSLIDANGQIQNQATFPAVSSGQHFSWIPSAVGWSSDGDARVVMPAPDLLYEVQSSAVIELPFTGDPQTLTAIDIRFPADAYFSPDGTWVAYLGNDPVLNQDTLQVTNLQTGDTQPLTQSAIINILDWQNDLLFVIDDALLSWSPAEGVQTILPIDNPFVTTAYTPSGDLLVITQNSDRFQIQDVTTGEILIEESVAPEQAFSVYLIPGIQPKNEEP